MIRHRQEPEVLVIHRPRYDDWSLPKGKLQPGETFVEAGVREVREETGLTCRILGALPTLTYRDQKNRAKLVRYWLMEPASGSIRSRLPDDEVDEVRWVTFPEAHQLLTYDRDRGLLDAVEL